MIKTKMHQSEPSNSTLLDLLIDSLVHSPLPEPPTLAAADVFKGTRSSLKYLTPMV